MSAAVVAEIVPRVRREVPAIRRRVVDATRQAGEYVREHDLLPLAGFVAAVAGAVTVGALAGASSSPRDGRAAVWYRGLRKGKGNPPAAVFPVVWTALYGMTAVSGWRVWQQPSTRRRDTALALWATQIGLNAAWSPLFFGARRPKAAMVDLLGLWGALAAYTAAARKVDRTATLLTLPYLAWVSYAGYLNGEILRKNPPVWRRLLGGH